MHSSAICGQNTTSFRVTLGEITDGIDNEWINITCGAEKEKKI